MSTFTDEEVRRYARQMVLPEVGGVGQARLRAASAEASDELEALYLAAAGVGTLRVPSPEIAAAVEALNPLVRVSPASASTSAPVPAVDACLRAVATLKRILEL
jgi:adenylyltransferase/sulfurtransferase